MIIILQLFYHFILQTSFYDADLKSYPQLND